MILCCGEVLIDMLPRSMPSGEEVYLPVPGGAIFNTAIALGRLGKPSGFLSSISTDLFGDQLVEALDASNVDAQWCVRSAQPSTLAFVKLRDGTAQYSFFDENSAGRNLGVDDLHELPADIKALHFGAISLIQEPCGSTYEQLMCNNQDRLISLDPNIRPGFVDNEKLYRERLHRMIAMADIVKVSDDDLEWLAGENSGSDAVDQWLQGGANVVLLTRGENGVSVFTRHTTFEVPAQSVRVVDTVGAGDTFNAGFLASLAEQGLLDKHRLAKASEDELKTAVGFASSVAAITCSRAGANPPWSHELPE